MTNRAVLFRGRINEGNPDREGLTGKETPLNSQTKGRVLRNGWGQEIPFTPLVPQKVGSSS